ncbi:MAG: serine/threonine protein kinase, partial [Myxococcales bacterium]
MTTAAFSYPAIGEVIDGKYRIDRILGEGGMGAVMGALHVTLKDQVALKFISPDVLRVPGAVERFVNEGVAARGIKSDHVVRIDDVGVLPSGLPFLVMEMLQGCDLSELLTREAPRGLPTGRAVHFVLQILRGLQAAHGRGVIHRDLKPSNAYVITRDGEPDFVKLLDFGISKISADAGQESQALTQTNTGLGTPLYMSPEQARNARDANARSDLYSVSAILYELLTGRTPYLAETPNDLLFKLFTAQPDPIVELRPDLPPGLVLLIHQGLSKE